MLPPELPQFQMFIGNKGQSEFMAKLTLLEAGVRMTQNDISVNDCIVGRRKEALFAFKHLDGEVLPDLKAGELYSLKFVVTHKVDRDPHVRHWRTCRLEEKQSLMHIHTVRFLLEDVQINEITSLDSMGRSHKQHIMGHNKLICNPLTYEIEIDDQMVHKLPPCPCIQAYKQGYQS